MFLLLFLVTSSLVKTLHRRIQLGEPLIVFKRNYLFAILFSILLPLSIALFQISQFNRGIGLDEFRIMLPVFLLLTTFISIFEQLILSGLGFYAEGVISNKGIFYWTMIKSAKFNEEECTLRVEYRWLFLNIKNDIDFKIGQSREDVEKVLTDKQIVFKE
jgi:hypothetical protein